MMIPTEGRATMTALRAGHSLEAFLEDAWARRQSEERPAGFQCVIDATPEQTFAATGWPNKSRMGRRLLEAVSAATDLSKARERKASSK